MDFKINLVGALDEQKTSKKVNDSIKKVSKDIDKIELSIDTKDIIKEKERVSKLQSQNLQEQIKLNAQLATNINSNNESQLKSLQFIIRRRERILELMDGELRKEDVSIEKLKQYDDMLKKTEIRKKEYQTKISATNQIDASKAANTLAVDKGINWSSNKEVKTVNELIVLENKLANSRKLARSEEARNLQSLLEKQKENIRLYQSEIELNGANSANAKKYKSDIEATNREISTQKVLVKELENESVSLWDKLTDKAREYFNYAIAAMTLQQAGQAIRSMVNEVVELDGALVELRKVTDLEGESLNNFIDKAYNTAQNVAKTGKDMIEATTEFAKSGYDPDAALELGEIALMYGNIADEEVSAGDAANFIIAQMKAFNIEAKDAMHIIDAVNEVSNNFAVSSADIANNLGKASAVMANAGNSMEEYIAMMTAITEITRSADKAANGLKTLTLRLQGMDDEGEESLEVQAKMEALFNKLGISVYKANGELKNTYEIMGTLAPIYQNLTNAEKAYVTETIAGKYQAQNAAALLQNWTKAVEANETAINSQGSALTENEKVLNSIEGKINAFNSAFQNLARTMIDSNLIKGVIDLGSALLNVANSGFGQFIIKTTALLVLFKAGSSTLDLLGKKFLVLTGNVQASTVAIVSNRLAHTALNKQTQKDITQLLSQKNAINKTTGSINTETLALIKQKLALSGLSAEMQKAILKQITETATQQAAAKTTNILTASWKKLTAAIAANPIGVALLAITALASGVSYLTQTAERAKEKYNELQQEFEEAEQKVTDLTKELEENKNQIDELLKKDALTYTDQKALDDLQTANDKLETQLELYEKIAEAKKKEAQDAANKAYNAEYNGDWSYKILTNDGKLEDTDWTDYVLPWKNIPLIYHFISGDAATYGYDTDVITEAVNQYADLADQAELTEEELERMGNLQTSLLTQLGKLEEIIPTLSGEAKEEAQAMRDYIVQFVTPDVWQKEKVTNFFGDDKEQFADIQKEMDELYKKGELTSKKIWELRKDSEGNWNELDAYMRDNYLDNSSIIMYYDEIYKAAQESAKKEADAYKYAAEARKEAGTASNWDNSFVGYLNGDYHTNASSVLELYENLKKLADEGKLTAEAIETLNEKFKFLSSEDFPEERLQDIIEILQYFNEEVGTSDDILSSYSKQLDVLSGQYSALTSAVDEYNEAGYLSADTLSKLISNDLIQYLSYENGQLVANTQAFKDKAEAERISASQTLTTAMMNDILNVAIGDVDEASSLARTAVANLGTASENAGNKASAATGKFISFAEAVDQTNKALSGQELTDDIKNKIAAVQNAYKPYYDLLSKPITFESKYTGKSKSSSSKSQKEWWEDELQKLKDQFNYNEITIEEYINGLDKLLGKTEKGSEAWNKINEELQKQRLSKVEDDYKAGRISLEQYIAKLKELLKAYKEGTKAWNDLAEKIKKGLQDQAKETKSNYDDAKSAIDKVIDDEIEKLQDQIDLLKEKNDETERAIELARLQEALENAKNNKTKRVWNGSEWVWMADQDAIDAAQKALDDFLLEDKIDEIQEQIDDLNDLKNQYADVTKIYDQEQQKQQLIAMLGANAEADILNKRLETLNNFKNKYIDIQKQIANYEKATPESLVGGNSPSTDVSSSSSNGSSSSGSGTSLSQAEIDRLAKEVIRGKYGNGQARKNALGANYSAVQNRVNQMLSSRSYASGGIVDYTGLAMLHGSPSRPEVVMNYDQIKNLMASITRPSVQSNISGTGQSIIYNFSGDFNLPNVDNAQKFLRDLKAQVNIRKHSI